MSAPLLTLDEFSRRVTLPNIERLADRFKRDNPDLWRRIERNARRRERYAEHKIAMK